MKKRAMLSVCMIAVIIAGGASFGLNFSGMSDTKLVAASAPMKQDYAVIRNGNFVSNSGRILKVVDIDFKVLRNTVVEDTVDSFNTMRSNDTLLNIPKWGSILYSVKASKSVTLSDGIAVDLNDAETAKWCKSYANVINSAILEGSKCAAYSLFEYDLKDGTVLNSVNLKVLKSVFKQTVKPFDTVDVAIKGGKTGIVLSKQFLTLLLQKSEYTGMISEIPNTSATKLSVGYTDSKGNPVTVENKAIVCNYVPVGVELLDSSNMTASDIKVEKDMLLNLSDMHVYTFSDAVLHEIGELNKLHIASSDIVIHKVDSSNYCLITKFVERVNKYETGRCPVVAELENGNKVKGKANVSIENYCAYVNFVPKTCEDVESMIAFKEGFYKSDADMLKVLFEMKQTVPNAEYKKALSEMKQSKFEYTGLVAGDYVKLWVTLIIGLIGLMSAIRLVLIAFENTSAKHFKKK